MCAKVTGPLFSMGARGSLGKAIVFSFWKGTNVVREYLKPANPKSESQGDRRLMLGGLGRAPKYVQKGKIFEAYAKAVAPTGQSWMSYFVKYIMVTYFADNEAYLAFRAAFLDHTAKALFEADAATLGLTDFVVTYSGIGYPFSAGMQLYALAVFGCDQYALDNTKFTADPYATVIGSWEQAHITAMTTDFSAAE